MNASAAKVRDYDGDEGVAGRDQRGIPEQIERLEAARSNLDKLVSQFGESLGPVLCSGPPESGDAKMGMLHGDMSAHASAISTEVDGLSSLTDRLRSMLHRLDV